MTIPARAIWWLFLLVTGLSILLWCCDLRVSEQTRIAVEDLSRAEQRLAASRRERERRAVIDDQAREQKADVPAAKPAEKQTARASPNPSKTLRSDPKIQASYFAAKRASVLAAYGPLFRKLGLSPTDTNALKDLILQREEDAFDTAAAVPQVFTAMAEFDDSEDARLVIDPYDAATYSAGRLPPDSMNPTDNTKTVVSLLSQGIDNFTASSVALLGQDGFDTLKEFERILPLQPKVREFAGVLALASQPLEMAQADALAQALAQATPSYHRGGDAIPGSIDWDKATESLSSVLTPAQMDALHYRLQYARESKHFEQEIDKLRGK